MAGIGITGLGKHYGALAALDEVSLAAREGEFLTLLGPSGCGKTTTLRCLAGLEKPDRGEITIGGDVVTSVPEQVFVPPEKRDIGMVFQSYALWPQMTVFQNVAYPLRRRREKRPEVQRRVTRTLEMVGLAALADRPVTRLSGGQQQRVALARALVGRPRVVLYDEPLSNLDAKLRATMRIGIRDFQRELGTTAVYVTHDQVEAMSLSDRIVLMKDGRVQQVGTPRDIYERPRTWFVADFVGYENFFDAEVVERAGDRAVARLDGGIALRCAGGPPTAGRVRLCVRSTALKVVPARGDGSAEPPNTLDGRVRDSVYLGGQVEHYVEAAGTVLRVRAADPVPPGEQVRPGEAVRLRIPPESIVVLDADEEAPEPATGGKHIDLDRVGSP
ncbi:ABC transporter ATP-binding protein [Actinomadura chibensis]|uniref:ABC transporter ATP-binding protein n=1 Tax=Actinomadura chibensis TaxID=392828 RepID=A0A5D0NDH6_9ACTN|nr:ABC transporter ATP-binding protein [Actinomadura chibensis]TYB42456.1 ABC transporter ATP-binding protein [Actinomadura chibensis]